MSTSEQVVAATNATVSPNRRGARSRERVLDAAEQVMAEHGYDGATLSGITAASGIPASSVYHYFGSKTGVLLAVMERGSERFFADLPLRPARDGSPLEHLTAGIATIRSALDEHPDFLRLLVALAVQPPTADEAAEVRVVVNRIRDVALTALRLHLAVAFDRPATDPIVDRMARTALALIDGAFVARQADPDQMFEASLRHLPTALAAIHETFVLDTSELLL